MFAVLLPYLCNASFFSIIDIAAVRHVGFSKIKNDNYRLDLCVVVQNFIQIGRLVAGI